MDWVYELSKTLCYLSSLTFLFLILLIILIKKKYQVFYSTVIISTTSGMLNGTLKPLFQIPLMPHLGTGFAFPSGHLQMSTVFYGYLYLQGLISRPFYLILIFILAWAMYAQNFHTPIELLAGFITGLMVLVVFRYTPILKYKSVIFLTNSILISVVWFQHTHLKTYLEFYSVSCCLLIFKQIMEWRKFSFTTTQE